jgi:hypothetical protein
LKYPGRARERKEAYICLNYQGRGKLKIAGNVIFLSNKLLRVAALALFTSWKLLLPSKKRIDFSEKIPLKFITTLGEGDDEL